MVTDMVNLGHWISAAGRTLQALRLPPRPRVPARVMGSQGRASALHILVDSSGFGSRKMGAKPLLLP